jgi:hypothetical protein
MRHRLPIASPPVASEAPWQGPRLPLHAGSVGIADTERGLQAAEFAAEFAEAAQARAIALQVTLVDFASAPALPAALAARFEASSAPWQALRVTRERTIAKPHDSQVAGCELWVGAPALVALVPALSILIGSERPRHAWPESLREREAGCQLVITHARPGIARALVHALCARGFLPVRSVGVR